MERRCAEACRSEGSQHTQCSPGRSNRWVGAPLPASDIITAIAIGIVSGLGATGINQIFKQMKEEE